MRLRVRVHGLYFNPRAPYGARLDSLMLSCIGILFQSTRPLRGATSRRGERVLPVNYFNPRAPYGARRAAGRPEDHTLFISIHAPLTGRDEFKKRFCIMVYYFNPRAPYGARPFFLVYAGHGYVFQSTRPLRGATSFILLRFVISRISIHAPLTGRDEVSGIDSKLS